MIAHRLYAENFIGLPNKQVTIDLSSMNGLIALRGANGAGKSTILSMLTPYTVIPRVGGVMVSIGDCIYDTSKDAVKILDFEFKNELYRSKIIVRVPTKGNKKTFAYLYKLDNKTLKERETLVDGRISEYEEYLDRYFINEKIYFSVFFTPQMSLSFAQYSKRDLRELLGIFINSKFYEHLHERAKTILDDLKETQIELNAKKSMILQMQSQMQNTLSSQNTEELKKQLKDLKDQYQSCKQTIADIQKKIESANKELNELNVERYKTQNHYEQLIEHIKTQEAELTKELSGVIKKIKLYQEVISKKDEILIADNNYPIVDDAIKLIDISKQKEVLERQKEQIQEAITVATQAKKKIEEMQSEISLSYRGKNISNVKEQVNKLQKETGILEKVLKDIADKKEIVKDINCNNSECILIKDIYDTIKQEDEVLKRFKTCKKQLSEAQKALQLMEQVKELEKSIRPIEELKKEYSEKIEVLEEYASIQKELNDRILLLKGDDRDTILDAVNKRNVKGLEAFKKQYLSAITNKSLLMDAEHQLFMLKAEQENLQNKLKELNPAERVKQIVAEKDSKINEYHKIITDKTAKIKQLQQDIQKFTQKADAINAQVVDIQSQLNLIEAQKKQIEELNNNMITLNNQIALQEKKIMDYRIIKEAYSPDGIPDMVMNEVIEAVSEHTNMILSNAFENNYSVHFKTIKTTKSGNENATLEIFVNDNRDSTSKHISMLSGGEQVWITTALAISLCDLYCQQYGINKADILIDEKDGTLDKLSREKFFLLLSKGMSNRTNNVYLISQSPTVSNYANYIINVHELGSNNLSIGITTATTRYDLD